MSEGTHRSETLAQLTCSPNICPDVLSTLESCYLIEALAPNKLRIPSAFQSTTVGIWTMRRRLTRRLKIYDDSSEVKEDRPVSKRSRVAPLRERLLRNSVVNDITIRRRCFRCDARNSHGQGSTAGNVLESAGIGHTREREIVN